MSHEQQATYTNPSQKYSTFSSGACAGNFKKLCKLSDSFLREKLSNIITLPATAYREVTHVAQNIYENSSQKLSSLIEMGSGLLPKLSTLTNMGNGFISRAQDDQVIYGY